ncbi:MAG: branched-chain amino acid ABC transporter permease [Acidimicrobiales bacterium]
MDVTTFGSMLAQDAANAGFIATFINTTAKGLAIGGVYAIIALGFVITFKATQVVNFAQGALAASGGLFLSFLVFDRPDQNSPPGQTPFTTWRAPFAGDGLPDVGEQWASVILISVLMAIAVGALSGWKSYVTAAAGAAGAFVFMLVVAALNVGWIEWVGYLFIALLFGALLGMILERLAIRPMIGEPLFSMAVITLGLEIAVRVFTNDSTKILNRPIQAPWRGDPAVDETPGGFVAGGLFYNWSYFAIYLAVALSFIAVYFFYRSKLGVAMRAVSFDQEAAMAQGIKVGQVFAIAWAAGAALAVLGGVFATQPPIDQAGAVGLTTVFVAFRALPAVILGGLDSVQGALAGGLLIGLAEIYAGQYLSHWTGTLGPGYQQIVPYIVMMAVLLVRPFGLFGTPEIRRV